MRPAECPREAELLEAIGTGAWPDCCAESMRRHVRACEPCAQLADLAPALQADQRAAVQHAIVPSSAVMWWKLQLRARQEETARAMRPIAAIQGISLACAAGLLAGLAWLLLPGTSHVTAWLRAIVDGSSLPWFAAWPTSMAALASPAGLALALVATLLLIVTPVAIYFAVSDR